MLKRVLQFLFGRRKREVFHDPVLGDLAPTEWGWAAAIRVGEDSFSIEIGGDENPDMALLAHGRDIVAGYESLKQSVTALLQEESRDYPPDAQAEVMRQEIDCIGLFWPDRPHDGMIFFRGSDNDIGAWRCDYINRRPCRLGCDT